MANAVYATIVNYIIVILAQHAVASQPPSSFLPGAVSSKRLSKAYFISRRRTPMRPHSSGYTPTTSIYIRCRRTQRVGDWAIGGTFILSLKVITITSAEVPQQSSLYTYHLTGIKCSVHSNNTAN
eukprot:6211098-Pleurochrysis_carterae.AAC.4